MVTSFSNVTAREEVILTFFASITTALWNVTLRIRLLLPSPVKLTLLPLSVTLPYTEMVSLFEAPSAPVSP